MAKKSSEKKVKDDLATPVSEQVSRGLNALIQSANELDGGGKKPDTVTDGFQADASYDSMNRMPRSSVFGAGPSLHNQVKRQQDRIMDQIFAGIPTNEGYYMKLSKEVAPNQWEFKEKIDDWQSWSDAEWEVVQIVRANTKKNPRRWGSGTYRLMGFRDGGMRDPRRDVYTFNVDAQEPDISYNPEVMNGSDAGADMADQMSMLANLLKVAREGAPTPDSVTKMTHEAYLAGKSSEQSNKSVESTAQTQMMQMMTELVKSAQTTATTKPVDNITPTVLSGMMATMGELIKSTQAPKQDGQNALVMTSMMQMMGEMVKMSMSQATKPVTDNTITIMLPMFQNMFTMMGTMLKSKPDPAPDPFVQLLKMKELGFIQNPGQSGDATEKTVDMVNKLIPLVTSLSGTGGAGEPSIGIEIVRQFAPQIGKIVSDIKEAVVAATSMKRAMPGVRPVVGEMPLQGMDQALQGNSGRPELTGASVVQRQDSAPVSDSPYPDRESVIAPVNPYDPGIDMSAYDTMPSGAPIQQPSQQPVASSNGTINKEEGIAMLPVLKDIKTAVEKRDVSFFPKLREIVIDFSSDENYLALLDNRISVDQVLTQIRPFAGEWVFQPATKEYFNRFLAWAKAKLKDEITVYCSICNESSIYENEKVLQMYPNCSECGTVLTKEPSVGRG